MKNRLLTIVIGVLILGTLCYFILRPERMFKEKVTFRNCSVKYFQYKKGYKKLWEEHYITNKDELNSAYRELALCLCEEYLKDSSKEVEEKIIEILKNHTFYYDSEIKIDSIIKNKELFFNPNMGLD